MIDRDEEHLRLLKLGYYVLAGITGLFSFFPAVAFGILGGIFSSGAIPVSQQSGGKGDPRVFGTIMLVFAAFAFVAGALGSLAAFITARGLRDHRRRTFCFVVAICTCLYVPWGTLIGVCTILVLNRPSVKMLFSGQLIQPTTLDVLNP